MKNKGFTLTELLIALAVIGLLIAILMPIIINLMPDKKALMAKRAYYTLQTITNSLLNDDACYPDLSQAPANERRYGFDDGFGYPECAQWGGSSETNRYINLEDPNAKFITLFKDKLEIKKGSEDVETDYDRLEKETGGCRTPDGGFVTETTPGCDVTSTDNPIFSTRDGVKWSVKKQKLEAAKKDSYIEFLVDVNGDEKPNCRSKYDDEGTNCSSKKDFDQFTVKIYADGKISIDENWANKAIDANHDITGSQE